MKEGLNMNNKVEWKPGNMVYPVPAALVSCGTEETGYNAITVAWTGTLCTNPPMTYISLRPSRYSYDIIKKTGAFVINLTTEAMAKGTDYCGVRSGRDEDKASICGFTYQATKIKAPLINESPVSILCEVTEIVCLGSHDMFMAKVVGLFVDGNYIDEGGRFHLDWAKPIAYAHGRYYGLGKEIGTFGYSVKKPASKKKTAYKATENKRKRKNKAKVLPKKKTKT